MDYLSHNEAETEALGEALAAQLQAGDVVAYLGGLGAGKTAFTRGLARGLGYGGRVTSPTFTIVNEYEGMLPLFHFDMYRLGNEDELFDIGWEEYLHRGGVCPAKSGAGHTQTEGRGMARSPLSINGSYFFLKKRFKKNVKEAPMKSTCADFIRASLDFRPVTEVYF